MPASTRIIPLGGLGEVGKNMTVYEADGEAVVVDAGLAFPRDEHLGVDLILPDWSSIRDRLATMAGFYGMLAGVKYAEPFLQKEIGVVDDLLAIPVKSI